MKKVIIFCLLSGFFLVGCGNSTTEKSTGKKVDQLESRVKKLETSSSSDDSKRDENKILSTLTTKTNQKIIKAFLDNDLEIKYPKSMDSLEHLPNEHDIENNPTKFVSQMSFNTGNLIGVDSIGIETYETIEDLNNAEKHLQDVTYGDLYMVTNNNILSLMYTYKPNDPEDQETMDKEFNKYKVVFAQIK